MKTYGEITKIPYLGPESDEPFAFKYYNPDGPLSSDLRKF